MHKYVLNPKPGKSVKVFGRALRVSTKSSVKVCSAITGKSLLKGKLFVENLVSQKHSLDGKYYTKSAKEIAGLLQSAEANAEFKGLDPTKMFIHASAHQGFTFMTPRRFKLRGRSRKVTHIQLILQQR